MFVIQESHNSTSAVNLRRVSLSSISKFIILHFIMHHLPLESNVLIRSVPQPNHENFCLLHYPLISLSLIFTVVTICHSSFYTYFLHMLPTTATGANTTAVQGFHDFLTLIAFCCLLFVNLCSLICSPCICQYALTCS